MGGGKSKALAPPVFGKARFGTAMVPPFQVTRLDESMLAYLQSAEIFCAPEEKLAHFGFYREVLHRSVEHLGRPDHLYYEAHMHSQPSEGCVRAKHPRRRHMFDLPAASFQLTSFCEALRQVNRDFSFKAIERLSETRGAAAAVVKDIFLQNRHFADLLVQLHYGDEIGHDAVNYSNGPLGSILEFSMVIRGGCVLWLHGGLSSDQKLFYKFSSAQSAGDSCALSPYAMRQGRAFPSCSWRKRCMFVQCRMLLAPNDMERFYEADESDVVGMMQALSVAASQCPLVLPSLNQVLLVEAELELISPTSRGRASSFNLSGE